MTTTHLNTLTRTRNRSSKFRFPRVSEMSFQTLQTTSVPVALLSRANHLHVERGCSVAQRPRNSSRPLSTLHERSITRTQAVSSLIDAMTPGASTGPLRAPLDFYALLHVSRGATKDSIFKSYERLSAAPPAEFGFSEKALAARKSVLDTAMETLGSPVLRREYDERLQLESVDETLPRDVRIVHKTQRTKWAHKRTSACLTPLTP